MSCRPTVCICARGKDILLFQDHQARVSRCLLTFSSHSQSLKSLGTIARFYRHGRANTYTLQLRGAVDLWTKFRGYLTIYHSPNC